MSERRIYLDTNAIIRLVEDHDQDVLAFFWALRGKAYIPCTSELTLAEVLVAPLRDGDHRLVLGYEELLQSDESMIVVPVHRDILRDSAVLRASLGGKTPDAIHVATAVSMECRLLVSSDTRLRVPEGMTRVALEDADRLMALS